MTKSCMDKIKNHPGDGAVANDVEAAQEMILSFPDFVYPEGCVHTIQEAEVPSLARDRTGFPQGDFHAGLILGCFGIFHGQRLGQPASRSALRWAEILLAFTHSRSEHLAGESSECRRCSC